MSRRVPAVFVVGLTLVLGACASPEATRERAGGAGGDVGNRREVVRMHEGSDPYYQTPRMPGIEGPPLDSLRQAREIAKR